jgi:hypothetical protein
MAEEQPLGIGHVKAMLRSGAKELTQVLPAFPTASVQPVEEPGLVGNLTPQEVVQDKGQYEKMLDGYSGKSHGQEKDLER